MATEKFKYPIPNQACCTGAKLAWSIDITSTNSIPFRLQSEQKPVLELMAAYQCFDAQSYTL
jgi:hypothetical protein